MDVSQGIEILRWAELSCTERRTVRQRYRDGIYPLLTPLVVDPAHPFPYISGRSLNLAVIVADPRTRGNLFARVQVPDLPRYLLQVSPHRFVPLEDVIAVHLHQLYEGMAVLEHHAFRVTRRQRPAVPGHVTADLVAAPGRPSPQQRRSSPVVRLEVADSITPCVLDRLVTELGVDEGAVYRLPAPLGPASPEPDQHHPGGVMRNCASTRKSEPELAEVNLVQHWRWSGAGGPRPGTQPG